MNFEYGFVARSIYVALIWFTAILAWTNSEWLLYYILFLAFLGLGLKPLLLKSGIYVLYHHINQSRVQRSNDKRAKLLHWQVEQDRKRERLKVARKRDSELPKNW